MEEENNSLSFWKRVALEGLVLGILVAGINKSIDYFIAPNSAATVLITQNKLNTRKEVFSEALDIVNRYYGRMSFTDDKGNKIDTSNNIGGKYPTELEVNLCFSKLCVYADNKEIPLAFRDIFSNTTPFDRPILKLENFVNLLRKDLGNGNHIVDTTNDEYKYIRVPKPTDAVGKPELSNK